MTFRKWNKTAYDFHKMISMGRIVSKTKAFERIGHIFNLTTNAH